TNPLIIGFFERLEKAAYDNADVVTVHSEGNRDFLLKNGKVSDSKLITLHNWINVKDYEIPEHDGPFRRKLGLAGKFVIFFGGVLGPSQGLDMVIEAALQLVTHSEIVFLFVGDGTEKNRLMELASNYGLKNVIFHPFISKEDYERTLSEIDVGLVCLSSKNRTPVVPGKILSYMASGVAVLAFLNEQSDGHQIIKDANCGYSAISSDPAELVRLVQKIYEQREHLDELGLNGYHYAVSNFSKESCVNELEKALMQ
ncbi:MAG: glycosyltransferase family 4 protein, partial [Desulfomonilaceae bacterium]